MSVAVEENLQQKLSEIVGDLPVEKILEVIDFAEFLRQKNGKAEIQPKEGVFGMYDKENPNQRIAGLNRGEIWMSDDFNDDLGDEFWLGEDFKFKKDESND
jgi:hypothetical protein